ncbi:MAG: COG1615 family transporter [Leptolyngbyaceae cyanobacterium RM2_2_21]|nr:COG1615 family transporter [Leptolyngbyaceae cyanobacterium RM2_2_21]
MFSGLLVLLGGIIAPVVVQRLVVQPNELARERPYIERSIAFTRSAFDLDNIQVEFFEPDYALTLQDLEQNSQTINNIRVWDTRPLLESNRQLQQIRLYYEFLDADVDRYSLIRDDGTIDRRQVLISARELNYEQVPTEAKTWVNEHLIYTHGYGFTISPVNTAADSGLPDYFIQDIAHVPSSEVVRRSIPVGEPRIYFGELTDTYVMTRTRVEELDYPSGSDNVYNTYGGRAGITIGSWWQRLLFAKHLNDWQMLFTADFTPDTRLLFRRNIKERIETIAPFLRFDADPYLVVADVDQTDIEKAPEAVIKRDEPNYLYWIIDAYTTSARYPYSDPGSYDFNYIRNSVKIVVDAYHGSVNFYVADATDPIIQTWGKLFPNMFQSLDDLPPALREHIRYPQDFYQVQSDQLMTYHMTDPQVFYNREDQWRAPSEIYAKESQVVEPYYLIMRLPAQESAEFILLRPFTPAQRNNLVAWLAASSDGDRYGQMLLYRFPKQELVFGPEQIEARINQDPQISQRISLWDTQGSRANQGNLLVIPIEQSLLYVEPLYLEAEQNRLPILARVIVVYQNRIAMAATLEQSLEAVFGQNPPPSAPPILRELGENPATDELTPLIDSAGADGGADTGTVAAPDSEL